MSLKVLFITAEYSDVSAGGAGVYAYELCRALARKGVSVHVLTPGPQTTTVEVEENLTVHSCYAIKKPFVYMPMFYWHIKIKTPSIVRDENISCIHSNNNVGYWALGNGPLVATIHHPAKAEFSNFGMVQSFLNNVDVWLEEKIVKGAKSLIVTSHLVEEMLLKEYKNINNKLSIINVGFEPKNSSNIPTAEARERLSLPKNKFIIFAPGSARAKRKGAQYLFDALKKLNLENFVCIMTGVSREIGWDKELQTLIEQSENSNNIILPGEVPYSDIPLYYDAADLVVFPSLFEGFGIPVLESLAAKKPVIATSTGEIPYIIRNNENGILIPPADSEKLANAINTLYTNSDIRQKLGLSGNADIHTKFSWSTIADQLITLYRNIQ